jgi:hypothetical protein
MTSSENTFDQAEELAEELPIDPTPQDVDKYGRKLAWEQPDAASPEAAD